MNKHDEVRQLLYDTGFKFHDGRTALEMTDEEVEKFLVEFTGRMVALNRQLAQVFSKLAQSVIQAVEPMRDLGRLLTEAEEDASSR